MNTKLVILAVIIVAGAATLGISLYDASTISDDQVIDSMVDTAIDGMMDEMTSTTETGIPEIVNVGVMLPSTGDLASHGADNKIATELALVDFNAYLEETDQPWRMNLIIEDTQTDPVVALEKLQSLNSKGVKLILGTETSAELKNVKSYADSNGIIMLSPSSTSPKLAITDNIFRFIPDDTQQSVVLTKAMSDHKVVIPIYRGDVWGDGLYEAVKERFETGGGTVDQGIRYNPEITVFSTEASILADILGRYQQEYTNQEIAILIIGFSEVVHLFNSANSYDELHNVAWYGTDASSNDHTITADPIATEFATSVTFTTTQFSTAKNEKYQHVYDHLVEAVGSAPSNYAYSSYDSLFVLGLSIQETDSVDTAKIIDVIHDVARDYSGATGNIILNEYGDLAISDYELFRIHDQEWTVYGHYDSSTDIITIY